MVPPRLWLGNAQPLAGGKKKPRGKLGLKKKQPPTNQANAHTLAA